MGTAVGTVILFLLLCTQHTQELDLRSSLKRLKGLTSFLPWYGRALNSTGLNTLKQNIFKKKEKEAEFLDVYSEWERTADLHSQATRIPSYDWVCMGIAQGFRCAHCKASVMCIGGKAYLQKCSDGMTCGYKEEFGSYVCHPMTSRGCQCDAGRSPDPYNPSVYLVCGSFPHGRSSTVYVESCPSGYEYIASDKSCLPIPSFPKCVQAGTFPYKDDCRWYYICTVTGTYWQQIPIRCMEQNYLYSTIVGSCVKDTSVPKNDVCSPQKQARYVCTLWGLLIGQIFPGAFRRLCYEIV